MANMQDYVGWRGDLSMEQSPWNEIDAVLFSTVCYLTFRDVNNAEGHTFSEAVRDGLLEKTTHPAFPVRKQAFEAMAGSRRFGDCRMHHFFSMTDREMEMQFSAVCYDLPDRTLCVAFRGTDATVIGWREDLNMSLLEPVAGQEAAVFYLQKALELDDRPVRIVGHSKGGNLGMYAAAKISAELQKRIAGVYSFDGPGMAPDVFAGEGYQRIAPKIRHFVPQTSIIGLLMEYPRPYTVVRSTASGIQQHDAMSWQVYGPRFEELDSVDEKAETIRDTLHEWLEKSDRDERAAFLDTAFRMVESTKATTVGELMGDKMKNIRAMFGSSRDLDPEMKKDFGKLLNLFVSVGIDNVMDRVRARRADAKEEEAARKALEEAAKADRIGAEQAEAGKLPGAENNDGPAEAGKAPAEEAGTIKKPEVPVLEFPESNDEPDGPEGPAAGSGEPTA